MTQEIITIDIDLITSMRATGRNKEADELIKAFRQNCERCKKQEKQELEKQARLKKQHQKSQSKSIRTELQPDKT